MSCATPIMYKVTPPLTNQDYNAIYLMNYAEQAVCTLYTSSGRGYTTKESLVFGSNLDLSGTYIHFAQTANVFYGYAGTPSSCVASVSTSNNTALLSTKTWAATNASNAYKTYAMDEKLIEGYSSFNIKLHIECAYNGTSGTDTTMSLYMRFTYHPIDYIITRGGRRINYGEPI